jgi:hypothetical protein
MNYIRILALSSLAGAWIASGQHHDMDKCPMAGTDKCPMMQDHKMETRGDRAMGFSHEKTTHHFRLFKDGGAIEVEANDANDDASRDQIRQHLSHIAKMFSEGDFKTPMLIHDQTPPGVEIMQRRKGEIKYAYETTGRGARVRITTKNEDAGSAVHDFLRFQISEHKTGDPTEITPQ